MLVRLMPVGFGLVAQSYIPLLSPTAKWLDENAFASPGPNLSNHECVHYYLDGDSILYDTTYHVLRISGRRSYSNNVFPNLSYVVWYAGEFVALLREDTVERRVYMRSAGWNSSRLLYDFSVSEGPYPPTIRYYQSPDLEVMWVDTILLNDVPHRRINFNEYESVIEGIGATSGFMESGVGGEIHWMGQLVCHIVEDSADYIVTDFACPCYSNVGIQDKTANRLRIHPIPTVGLCHLEGGPPGGPFLIRALDGRIVAAGHCSGDGSATIDLSQQPGAIYVLEIRYGGGAQRAKILKQ